MPAPAPPESKSQAPTFRDALAFWLKLGFISFGGPAGQIAIMHRELVDRKKWVSEPVFLHGLNFCMLLPGPEAQQLATYLGWRLHGTRGGLIAGCLFILPSSLILWLLSWIYVSNGHTQWLPAVLHGLNAAVIAIVALAVVRIGSKVLKNPAMWTLAAAAFVSLFFLHAPFPLIVLGAALIGFAGGKYFPAAFLVLPVRMEENPPAVPAQDPASPTLLRNLGVICTGLALWLAPVLAVFLWRGRDDVLTEQSVFFGKAALVTFGGAYAVLPYVAQQAVEVFGWLSPTQMANGLALAETTPGPLIMVLQFVGFVGGWNHAGSGSPLFIATLASFLTTWVTFVPSFLWIFLGAPYLERLRGNHFLSAALSAITAAVAGVILNLAVWFSMNTLWLHEGRFDFFAASLALGAGLAMWAGKMDVVPVIAACGLLGLLFQYLS